jgi:non-ribosomal peptide synthetase component F
VGPTSGVHRLIEHHAATNGEFTALIDGDRRLTYRELNQRANFVARRLIEHGFRRSAVAVVRMERSLELAVVLLGVLKAGGAYTWIDDSSDAAWPSGISLVLDESGAEQACTALDMSKVTSAPAQPGPNLPILTRAEDAACVLRTHQGSPAVLVPHATITTLALQSRPSGSVRWNSEPAAFDLWLALLTGSTAIVTSSHADSAAA